MYRIEYETFVALEQLKCVKNNLNNIKASGLIPNDNIFISILECDIKHIESVIDFCKKRKLCKNI